MNDTSSRSHCITSILLMQKDLGTNKVTFNRFNFLDMMGSERFKGQNSAHDESINNKDMSFANVSGIEGILSNLSLC